MNGSDFRATAADALQPSQAWLGEFNARSRRRWLDLPLPGRRTEAWKYSPLTALTEGDFLYPPEPATIGFDASLIAIPDLAGPRLTFVDGRYNEQLSRREERAGLVLRRFVEASADERATILELLGSAADDRQNPFVALNGAWLDDGVYVDVAPGCDGGILHLVHVGTGGERGHSAQRRLLLRLGDNAQLTVVEHFCSSGAGQQGFVNDVGELLVGAGATLRHYRLHLEDESAVYVGGLFTRLARQASLDSFVLGLGSLLKRLDLTVQHQGEGSDCRLNAVYLPRRRQHIDLHATVEHEQPRGRTRETVRGIIADEARAVFNGRIHIHPHAQKTDAQLNNRNLLLSDRAEINTKPELEIYADDVQCAHGATVSQIDERSLYYLRSRGIDPQDAQVMLSFAFINELIEGVENEPVRALLQPVLRQWFGAGTAQGRQP